MSTPMFADEMRCYRENLSAWYQQHSNQWVLLRDDLEPQFFTEEEHAYFFAVAAYPDHHFFLKQVVETCPPVRVSYPVQSR